MTHPRTVNTPASLLLLAVTLTIVAAVPRFWNLGAPGFYGDEETTAFPARALAENGTIEMPSGMPYYRALPLTVANALSARTFGTDRELSYRLSSALLGTLTIPLLFFFFRPFAGTGPALLAALLLALSEWHIITSREARMYAPLLFFYLASGAAIWLWTASGKIRYLLTAAPLAVITSSLHLLGITSVLFALVPLAFRRKDPLDSTKLVLFAILAGIAAWLYNRYVTVRGFEQWIPAHSSPVTDTATAPQHGLFINADLFILPAAPALILAACGILAALWAARHGICAGEEPGIRLRKLIHHALLAVVFAAACTGHIHAAVLSALVFLAVIPCDPVAVVRKILPALLVTGVIAALTCLYVISSNGVVHGIKKLVLFPYPYTAYLAEMFPGVSVLALAGLLILLLDRKNNADYRLMACIPLLILPLALVGVLIKWGGARYLLQAYPFILLVAAVALHRLFTAFGASPLQSFGAAVVVILSGILGGHGIPQAARTALIDYGATPDRYALGFDVYPDHKSTGIYTREHAGDNDLVIAEDALQQYWYTGRVDYWLADPKRIDRYLYSAKDGNRYSIYTNTPVASAGVLAGLSPGNDRRIWIITSAEIRHNRELYLDAAQISWLARLVQNMAPVFTGADGISAVYCLGCEQQL